MLPSPLQLNHPLIVTNVSILNVSILINVIYYHEGVCQALCGSLPHENFCFLKELIVESIDLFSFVLSNNAL